MVVDCGSVSHTLIEGELFGAEKGAYTGAVSARAGALEQADGGTLFLDEIDDLPLELQPKLLRVLEEREVRRLGSTRARHLDLRIIAATKQDLARLVREGRFREDLFFRLSRGPGGAAASAGPHRGPGGSHQPPPRRVRELARLRPGPPGAAPRPQLAGERPGAAQRPRPPALPGPRGERDGEPPGPGTPEENDDEGPLPDVDFTLPFKEAKESLVDAFEREYLERLLERAGGRIAAAAREAHLNRKYFYDLLHKHGLYSKDR